MRTILLRSSILFLCVLQLTAGKNHKKQKFCDYEKNVYYSEALGDCKKCDPCFKGWGLVDDINFKIDTEKGALGCRVCRPCVEGISFQKRYKAFKKCKPCKVCKVPGQYETQNCTTTQNRKCRHNKQDEENIYPIMKEKPKQVPPKRTSTISLISPQNQLMTTTNNMDTDTKTNVPVGIAPISVPGLLKQAPGGKASSGQPSKKKNGKNEIATKESDFKENKNVFIVVAVFSVMTFTVLFGIVAKKTHVYIQERNCQQTAVKEIFENTNGQENKEVDNEADRVEETFRETSDTSGIEMESIFHDVDNTEEHNNVKTEAICIHNRSEGMNSNADNSLPLLPSDFSCNLPPPPQISALYQTTFIDSGIEDGIMMISDRVASISDDSDFERCDTPASCLGSSDVTNDGSSYCNIAEDEQFLTAKELQAVAHSLAPNFYKKVGRELGVTDNEMDIIRANNPDNVEEIAYNVLKKWTEKGAPFTTKKYLKEALIKVHRADVLQLFCDSFKEFPKQ